MEFPRQYGRYILLEAIGAGGMAQVFRAKSVGVEGFEKTVVIKRILPGLAKEREFVEMFISEAKLAVSLSHPNIVQIFDLGKERDDAGEESIYIAMEHVDGADLAELLRRRIERHRRAFPPALAGYIVAEVAKALDYAHRRRDPQGRPLGLVHRDISPQNVLVSFDGDVKLTDFGIAKVRQARKQTEVGILKGKYGYMSPEQVRGEPIDGRSDLFSLGIVFFELLWGRRLFKGQNPVETLTMIEEVRIPDPREAIPGLPEPFLPILKRALTREPEDRYPSAAEMAGDLLALLFSLGKPLQRDELGSFLREILELERREDATPQALDPATLLEALRPQTPAPAPPSAEKPRMAPRPTIEGKRLPPSGPHRGPEGPRRPVYVLAAPAEAEGALAAANARSRRIVSRYLGQLGPEGEGAALAAFFEISGDEAAAAERAARCALELIGLAHKGEEPPKIAVARSELPARGIDREAAERAAAPARELARRAAPAQVVVDDEARRALGAAIPSRPLDGGGAALEIAPGRYVPPLSSEPFIGRRQEMRAIVGALAQAAEGDGQICALTGPPGIGKTRIIGELKLLLKQRQIALFSGRCAPSVVPEPYHVIRDVFYNISGAAEARDPAALRERLLRLKLFKVSDREIEILFQMSAASRGGDRDLPRTMPLFDALNRVINEVTKTRPLVLALEDLQWLDGPSRDVLDMLFDVVDERRMLLLLTWRAPQPADPKRPPPLLYQQPLGQAAAEVRLPEGTRAVALPPLSPPEIEELGAALLEAKRLAPELKSALVHRSGGNPLFAMELLRAHLERGDIERRDGEAHFAAGALAPSVPVTLQAILRDRLAALTEAEERALAAAAVLGPRFDERSLKAGLGAPEPPPLDSLVQKGVLEEAGGGSYAFSHDLLREIVYDRLPPEARRAYHGRLAQAAEAEYAATKSPQAAEAAARHLEGAGELSRAAPRWEEAADARAKLGDRDGAWDRYRRAMESRRAAKGGAAELLPVALKATAALGARGDVSRGLKFLDELSQEIASADAPTRAAFALLRGELSLSAGDLGHARTLLEEAQKAPAARVSAARLPLSLGRLELFSGEPKAALGHLTEAVRLARDEKAPRLLGEALSALGRAYVYAGSPDEAEACFAESMALAESAKDRHSQCRAMLRRAILPFMRRDFEAALAADKAALEMAEAEGFQALAAHAAHYVGVDLVYLDDPGRAYTLLERSLTEATELGLSVLAWTNDAYLGYLDTLLRPDGPGLRRLLTAKERLTAARARPKIAQAYYLLGRVNLARKSRFLAKRHFQDALRLAEEIGHVFLVGEVQRLQEELDAG